MPSRSHILTPAVSTPHPLRRTYRPTRIASLTIVACLLAYFSGGHSVGLDISAERNNRAVSLGELVCYLGAFAIAWEIYRPSEPWETGWIRQKKRVALNGIILTLSAIAYSLICGYALVNNVGPEVRWWIPLVNSLGLCALLLLSSRILPTLHFLSWPFGLMVLVLMAQVADIPGSHYILLAGYSPADSPDVMYWAAVVTVLWLLTVAPVDRIGRLLRSTGYLAS